MATSAISVSGPSLPFWPLSFFGKRTVLALAGHQNAHRHEQSEFDLLAHVACIQQYVPNKGLASPEVPIS